MIKMNRRRSILMPTDNVSAFGSINLSSRALQGRLQKLINLSLSIGNINLLHNLTS
jgi:hypothetical protein